MKAMLSWDIFLLGFFLALFPFAAAAEAPPLPATLSADHWPKLLDRWDRGTSWLPHRLSFRSEEIGKKGETVGWEENDFSLSYPRTAEDPDTTILKSVKDGKDITEERKKKASPGRPPMGQDAGDSFPDAVPFLKEVQGKLSWKSVASSPVVSGLGYTIAHAKRKVQGSLSLDDEGRPRTFSYTYDPLPNFVNRFDGKGQFKTLEDGSIVLESMALLVEGSILMIRKKYSITMSFSDYRLK
jgi:hypothetical protein